MPYSSLLSVLALSFAALAAEAAEFIIRDQQGQPLANAVLLVDGDVPPSESAAVMDQIAMRFEPHVLVIPRGARVDFPNSDDVRHHVYSFSPAKPFELRLFKGSEAPPVAFDQAGVVVLGCNIHDQMLGYILVTDSPAFAVSDAQGRVVLPAMVEGSWELSWWHPELGQQPPQSLGLVALGEQPLDLVLPITPSAGAEPAPKLSPLQQRFRKATHDAGH